MLLEFLLAKRLVLPETLEAEPLGRLPSHAHSRQLRSVEFEDGAEASRFDCGGCGEVLFR
jgi:hypothetical protein